MPARCCEIDAPHIFNLDEIGSGLPVADCIEEVTGVLSSPNTSNRLVLQAPPGSGKTTLVPPAVSNITTGVTLVTSPRRVAVRAAATRLAALSGEKLGNRVGYRMRGDSVSGSQVEFLTPGVLMRMLLYDPELGGVGAVIIDEVHERQLDTDVVLGTLTELTQLREDLSLTVMSATLDTRRFSEVLGDAPVITTEALSYPLEISYAPHSGRLSDQRQQRSAFYRHLGHLAVREVNKTGHSALIFVPGAREVDEVLAALPAEMDAFSLHGRLDNVAQDRALRDSETPRIVVATSIAETSLTVPGVRIVVDSGLSRVPRRDARRAMTGLVTVSEARSTAGQRAGRAGREGPGTVIRAFPEADLRRFPEQPAAEILTSDLTQACLWLAAWGTPRGEGLPLPDAPPTAAITTAEETLISLGALTEDGTLTEVGERLATLPVDPRLGRALLDAGDGAAGTVALLSDPPAGDLALATPPKREVERLARLAGRHTSPVDPGVVTALAFPQQVALNVAEGEYLLASGTRARLPKSSSLIDAPWLAIAEVSLATSGAVIRSAARITHDDAEKIVGTTTELHASVTEGKITGRRVRRLGAITLSSTPVKVPADQAAKALATSVRDEGLEMFPFSDKAQQLFDRLVFLHQQLGEPWPDPGEVDPLDWLGPELERIASGTPLGRIDYYPAVQRLLPWPEAMNFDELAPTTLTVPSGSNPQIHYDAGRPVVRVKLQECFGMTSTPVVCGVPVQFHLLSPAGRELALTDDLMSFFSGPYAQVRAEMRGRYPKHPWPEDPFHATATAKTKRR